jgi:hypothetical protein
MQGLSPSARAMFAAFVAPLVGLPVSHVWQGYGSALFLEFGELRPTVRRDRSAGNPDGEMGLMLDCGWRIEGRRSILCGSSSPERAWSRALGLLRGAEVVGARLFGRLPEIEVELSNGARVLSFEADAGDPRWTLFDHLEREARWLAVKRGALHLEPLFAEPG